MNFNTKVKLLSEEVSKSLSLSIGKYKLFENLPGEIFDYADAPIHSTTRQNLELLKSLRAKFGEEVVWDKFYRVSKNGKKNAKFITGTIDNQPIIYAIQPSPQGMGSTNLYFKDNKVLKVDSFIHAEPYKGGWKSHCYYYKDFFLRVLHRLDGPAYDAGNEEYNQYWIDGKRIPNDIFHAMQKVNTPEDKESMTDLLNI
jgi:hypothetical protein